MSNKTNNILIVTPIFPPDIGGPATYAPELARRLAQKNSVTVVTFCKEKPADVGELRVVGVKLERFGLLRQLRLLTAIIKHSLNTSVIYAQGTLTVGLMSLVTAKILGKKLVIKFVGDEVWEDIRASGYAGSLEDYYKNNPNSLSITLHRLVLKQADIIIVPSQYLRDFLVKFHHVGKPKIEVINNPVEIKHQTSNNKQKIPNQAIFVGRLVKWKNVDQIIEAVVLAREQNPKLSLLIVGDGPEREKLEVLSQKYKANKYIKFLGKLATAETLKKIQESQKLILYSSYEGQPHVIIESFMLKTAVIISDIAPNRELVGEYGQKVKSNNVVELASAINQPLSPLPPTNFIKQFTWKNHLKQLSQVIKVI